MDFSYRIDDPAVVAGIFIGVLIGATIWGFVIRYLMKTKGYQNLGAWFCCGFFLGIIGLIIAVTRPDLKNQPFQNGNPYGSPYANPYGQPMQPPYPNQPYQYGQPMQPPYPPNAPYGMGNQPMPPYPNQPMMNTQPQGVRCPSCGMINQPGTAFCSQCGEKQF